ncbi:MAG: ribosome assembly factor SBDS [Candidatus Aenigmatarchaeota archaeon]
MSVSVEKSVIARLTKHGQKFEILVDPEKALDVKAGKDVPVDELLAFPEVYEDSKKGLKVSPETINKAFGTNEISEIAKKIIKEGEIQLTTEQRNRMLEDKKKAIVSIIARRGVNPQTGIPHPPERILNAMEQARVRIDLHRRAEEQIDSVIKEIQKILPISFEKVQIGIKVSAQYGARAAGIARNFGTVVREEWGADGSYMAIVKMLAAAQNDFYDKMNSLTHGEVQIKIIKKGG